MHSVPNKIFGKICPAHIPSVNLLFGYQLENITGVHWPGNNVNVRKSRSNRFICLELDFIFLLDTVFRLPPSVPPFDKRPGFLQSSVIQIIPYTVYIEHDRTVETHLGKIRSTVGRHDGDVRIVRFAPRTSSKTYS